MVEKAFFFVGCDSLISSPSRSHFCIGCFSPLGGSTSSKFVMNDIKVRGY